MTELDPRSGWMTGSRTTGDAVSYDAGLRTYMLSVYNYMGSGVLLTGLVALAFAASGMAEQVFLQPGFLKYIVMFAPFGLVLWLSFGINRLSVGAAQALFWTYAVTMGLSLSTIFLAYTGASIASTFFASAAAFGGLSLYGYTTKRDLSVFGTFLIMGLIGLVVAMLINLFMQSSAFAFVINAVGVLLFAGLTAYDTQRIRAVYFQTVAGEGRSKAIIMGALTLYLDFINLFLFLLRFMGNQRG